MIAEILLEEKTGKEKGKLLISNRGEGNRKLRNFFPPPKLGKAMIIKKEKYIWKNKPKTVLSLLDNSRRENS